jgi:hypothetical protein
MAKLEGKIAVSGLPPHCGMIVSMYLFPVRSADAPVPFGGDPTSEAVTDCHEVTKHAELQTDSSRPAYELPFRDRCSIG